MKNEQKDLYEITINVETAKYSYCSEIILLVMFLSHLAKSPTFNLNY